MKHSSLSTIAIFCLMLNSTSRTMDTTALALTGFAAAAGATVAYSLTDQNRILDGMDVATEYCAIEPCDTVVILETAACIGTFGTRFWRVHYTTGGERVWNAVQDGRAPVIATITPSPKLPLLESESGYRTRILSSRGECMQRLKILINEALANANRSSALSALKAIGVRNYYC